MNLQLIRFDGIASGDSFGGRQTLLTDRLSTPIHASSGPTDDDADEQ
jgi:hypothetical protein